MRDPILDNDVDLGIIEWQFHLSKVASLSRRERAAENRANRAHELQAVAASFLVAFIIVILLYKLWIV